MTTGSGFQLGLILRLNNQTIARGCWGTRGSTRLNSARVQIRAFVGIRAHTSMSLQTPNPTVASFPSPSSCGAVGTWGEAGRDYFHSLFNIYSNKLPSPPVSRASTEHPERGFLSPGEHSARYIQDGGCGNLHSWFCWEIHGLLLSDSTKYWPRFIPSHFIHFLKPLSGRSMRQSLG